MEHAYQEYVSESERAEREREREENYQIRDVGE